MHKHIKEPIITRYRDSFDLDVFLTTGLLISCLTQQPWSVESIPLKMENRSSKQISPLLYNHQYINILKNLVGDNSLMDEPNSTYFLFYPNHLPEHKIEREIEVRGSVGYQVFFLELLTILLSSQQDYSTINIRFSNNTETFVGINRFKYLSTIMFKKIGLEVAVDVHYSHDEITCRLDIEPSLVNVDSEGFLGNLTSSKLTIMHNEKNEKYARLIFSKIQKRLEIEGLNLRLDLIENDFNANNVFVNLSSEYEGGIGGFSFLCSKDLSHVDWYLNDFLKWLNSGSIFPNGYEWLNISPIILNRLSTRFNVGQVNNSLVTSSYIVKQFIPAYLTIIGKPGESGQVIIR